MSGFNGAGAFIRAHDWTADADAAINIRADRMDEEDDGFATGLSACITKDGQTTTTASIPFAAGLSSNAMVDLSNAAAGQIKFPAAQNASSNANTLDDYEEGTFTPIVTFGGGTTGITYTTQSGAYTKIGNRVLFDIFINLSSKGSSTGAMTITGLPFTAANTFDKTAAITGSNLVANTNPQVYVTKNTASLALFSYTISTGGVAAATDANINNNTTLTISGHYSV